METLEQKKRRMIGKVKYLDTYIKILNKIILKNVDPTMLLSIVDTDKIYPMVDIGYFNIDYKDHTWFLW